MVKNTIAGPNFVTYDDIMLNLVLYCPKNMISGPAASGLDFPTFLNNFCRGLPGSGIVPNWSGNLKERIPPQENLSRIQPYRSGIYTGTIRLNTAEVKTGWNTFLEVPRPFCHLPQPRQPPATWVMKAGKSKPDAAGPEIIF